VLLSKCHLCYNSKTKAAVLRAQLTTIRNGGIDASQ